MPVLVKRALIYRFDSSTSRCEMSDNCASLATEWLIFVYR